jgi:hypothetical protein
MPKAWVDPWSCTLVDKTPDVFCVIHQVAQAGFPEEPPKNEQAMLIHAEFSDSAGPEKAPFSVFPLL